MIDSKGSGEIGVNPRTPDKWYLVFQQEPGFLTTLCFDPETRKIYPQEITDENFVASLEVPEDIVGIFKTMLNQSGWTRIANKLGGEPKKVTWKDREYKLCLTCKKQGMETRTRSKTGYCRKHRPNPKYL